MISEGMQQKHIQNPEVNTRNRNCPDHRVMYSKDETTNVFVYRLTIKASQ